jgi:hypothetical protein
MNPFGINQKNQKNFRQNAGLVPASGRYGTASDMSATVRRAGIVSGYFNPLHVGHLRMMEG